LLFPQLASVRVLSVEAVEGSVVFTVRSGGSSATCPRCGLCPRGRMAGIAGL
jgi:hypothetical protein